MRRVLILTMACVSCSTYASAPAGELSKLKAWDSHDPNMLPGTEPRIVTHDGKTWLFESNVELILVPSDRTRAAVRHLYQRVDVSTDLFYGQPVAGAPDRVVLPLNQIDHVVLARRHVGRTLAMILVPAVAALTLGVSFLVFQQNR